MRLKNLSVNEYEDILDYYLNERKDLDGLFKSALEEKRKHYGNDIYLRALIEFTTYCKNNCFYCGLNRLNTKAVRYRLTDEEVIESAKHAYLKGYRTFVLQGGEDEFYTTDKLCDLIYKLKDEMADAAVTLSIGEKSKNVYKAYFDAGADRFLLRHETADEEHYKKLHEDKMSHSNRMRCLYDLKDIGFQTGAGFMVDSPYQTNKTLAKDLKFLSELEPEMIGIGPFIPHKNTVFKDYYKPDTERTLIMLALVRNILPKVLLPATTALATIDKNARQKAFEVGANVLMPNSSPKSHRKDYALYDGKENANLEAVENTEDLIKYIASIGYKVELSRGDHVDFKKEV